MSGLRSRRGQGSSYIQHHQHPEEGNDDVGSGASADKSHHGQGVEFGVAINAETMKRGESPDPGQNSGTLRPSEV